MKSIIIKCIYLGLFVMGAKAFPQSVIDLDDPNILNLPLPNELNNSVVDSKFEKFLNNLDSGVLVGSRREVSNGIISITEGDTILFNFSDSISLSYKSSYFGNLFNNLNLKSIYCLNGYVFYQDQYSKRLKNEQYPPFIPFESLAILPNRTPIVQIKKEYDNKSHKSYPLSIYAFPFNNEKEILWSNSISKFGLNTFVKKFSDKYSILYGDYLDGRDGKIIWLVDNYTGQSVQEFTSSKEYGISNLMEIENGVFFSISDRAYFFDSESKTVKWTIDGSSVDGLGRVVHYDKNFIYTGGGLCINHKKGEIEWFVNGGFYNAYFLKDYIIQQNPCSLDDEDCEDSFILLTLRSRKTGRILSSFNSFEKLFSGLGWFQQIYVINNEVSNQSFMLINRLNGLYIHQFELKDLSTPK